MGNTHPAPSHSHTSYPVADHDQHLVHFGHEDSPQDQYDIYDYRSQGIDPSVVQVYNYIPQSAGGPASLCQGHAGQSAKVFTESIPHTLATNPQLTFPESLYTACESLNGFKHLYRRVGPFQITDRMIGINKAGRVKVWMHEDFANNHPQYPRQSLLETTDHYPLHNYNSAAENSALLNNPSKKIEQTMVKNILDVVEYHTETGVYPEKFKNFMLNERGVDFNKAQHLIINYAQDNKINIPDRITDGKIVRVTRKKVKDGEPEKAVVEEVVKRTVPINPEAKVAYGPAIREETFLGVVPEPGLKVAPNLMVRPQAPQLMMRRPISQGAVVSPVARAFN